MKAGTLLSGILFLSMVTADAATPFRNLRVEQVFSAPQVAALVTAALSHDEASVNRLRKAGAKIDFIGDHGVTPLSWAVYLRDLEAVTILLKAGAHPDTVGAQAPKLPSRDGADAPPALWQAAEYADVPLVRVLLTFKANPDIRYAATAPMTQAVRFGCGECAQLLLDAGANINDAEPTHPITSLFAAVIAKRYDLAVWLLEHGYNSRLDYGKRAIAKSMSKPLSPEQQAWRDKALSLIDQKLAIPGNSATGK